MWLNFTIQYNTTELPAGADRLSQLMGTLFFKRARMQGFIVFDDYGHRYNEFIKQMSEWIMSAQIKYKEHCIEGLENAPQAFIGLLKGEKFAKLIVCVGEDS